MQEKWSLSWRLHQKTIKQYFLVQPIELSLLDPASKFEILQWNMALFTSIYKGHEWNQFIKNYLFMKKKLKSSPIKNPGNKNK